MLTGKTALVTGASRGIGLATFCALGEAGARVIGTATGEAGLDKIKSAAAARGFDCCAARFDIADAAGVQKVQDAAGGRPPDIVVANAAVSDDGLLMRMKDDSWEQVVAANLGGFYRLCRAFVGGMLKKRGGRIIGVSSVVARAGNVGQTNYCAAKAGMEGCIRALAREVGGRGVTVNAVAPGFIDTDMTQKLPEEWRQTLVAQTAMKRAGEAREVAAAIVFLASDEASYITGHTLHVNGGMFMN